MSLDKNTLKLKKMTTVDDYIASFPKDIQTLLQSVRKTILEKAPEAVESISYGMPAYKTNDKPLMYFAVYKNHIGFYATPHGHTEFSQELSNYKSGKGSVQFPLDQPIPLDLIGRIVEFKAKENSKKTEK
ncbi:MAG TPA: DUF1801 domain-containing protein [Mariniflexile sp.]